MSSKRLNAAGVRARKKARDGGAQPAPPAAEVADPKERKNLFSAADNSDEDDFGNNGLGFVGSDDGCEADAKKQDKKSNLDSASVSTDADTGEDEDAKGDRQRDDGEELIVVGNVGDLRGRISDTVAALSDWRTASKSKRWANKSRSVAMQMLLDDVCSLYSYSRPLAEYFLKLFSPIEAISFFEAAESPRPMILRTNLLKTRRRDLAKILIQRGANVDPLGDWTKVGLRVIDSSIPVGATPEYCGGHYMIQAASSFLSVLALAPQPGETILDMAAAPGGKSTYIGQLMKNQGVLICNELKKDRCASLCANLHRMGVRNAIVSNVDGRLLHKHMPKVDRVLLDAPCTGLGVISRDPSIKAKRSPHDFLTQSLIQKELLAAAVDLVDFRSKSGGVLVYSTCSVAVEENEAVIDWLLKVRDVQIIPLGCADDLGTKGFTSFQGKMFHPSVANARRLYPHAENFDGFFVAKIKKLSDKVNKRPPKEKGYVEAHWGEEAWKQVGVESDCIA